LGVAPAKFDPLGSVKHSITRYRITVNAYAVGFKTLPTKLDGVWKSPAGMQRLAFTAAHKKLASIGVNRILFGR
jgi:hypothetical protein